MSRGSEPAFPVADVVDHDRNFYSYGGPGLTVREHFAGLALQAILANPNYDPPRRNKLDMMATDALAAADALLAAIEAKP